MPSSRKILRAIAHLESDISKVSSVVSRMKRRLRRMRRRVSRLQRTLRTETEDEGRERNSTHQTQLVTASSTQEMKPSTQLAHESVQDCGAPGVEVDQSETVSVDINARSDREDGSRDTLVEYNFWD